MKNVSSKTLGLVQVALLGAIIVLMAAVPFLGYIPLGVMRATIIHVPVIIGSIVLGPKKGAVLGLVFGLTSLVNNTINPTITSFVFTPFYQAGDIGGNPLSLVVCLLPRILVGVVPYYVYNALVKVFGGRKGTDSIAVIIAGIAGSMTNTLLVMNFIYLFFGKSYAAAKYIATLTTAITEKLPDLSQEAVSSLAQSAVNALSDGQAAEILRLAGMPADAVAEVLADMSMSAANIYNAFILPTIGLNGILEAIVAAVITVAVVKPLMKINKQK